MTIWPFHYLEHLRLPLTLQYPEFLLLAIPIGIAYRRWGRAPGATGVLRVTILAAMLIALCGPQLNLGGKGVDILVVADRSRSMTQSAHENVLELIHNLQNGRKAGDRVGVVTFGIGAQVEQLLDAKATQGEYVKEVLPDGSDLSEALTTALNLVDKNRPARVLVLSDGESNGPDPISAARRAREDGVPIDYRAFERPRVGDVAVEAIQLPEEISPREPFQFTVDVQADQSARGKIRVFRDGKEFASRELNVDAGHSRLPFRDVLDEGGSHNYRVELEVAGDPIAENNRGAGVVVVDAGPRVLLLNSDGQDGRLGRAIRAATIPLDVAAVATHPLTQDSLDRYRAVIIENVPASGFGRVKMDRLAQFVEDLGGGLLLTGGERSFGVGGYFKSPFEALLPVTMELRQEHRKNRVAIAIALDRSGSMMAPVGGGKTKMDLADLGTAACVRLLSPSDMVAVIAVDSSPHIVQAMTPVEDPEAIASKVLTIESQGGGIFVYEALVAAGDELMKAGDYGTRHIILFSDAADSEEPGDYKNLLKKYADAGITCSVIGLGTKSDVDAALLEDVAKLGGGNIMFTADPLELPRLFTEDTMSVARNTFITKDESQPNGIAASLLSDSRLMGEFDRGGFPNINGYNLCYVRPEATQAVVTQDEYKAPLSAFWYRGLGRTAAVTLEVDGKHSGQFADWQQSNDFLVTHVRWLLGEGNPNDVFVRIDRAGQEAVATVELDPDRPNKANAGPPSLIVVPPGREREAAISPTFTWTGPDTLEARFRMDRTGTYRTLLKGADRKFTRGPAVTLPYSPEFVPRAGLPSGADTLRQVAQVSGGVARADVLEVFANPPRAAAVASLIPWLMGLGVALLILEIAGRRLELWSWLRSRWERRPEAEAATVPALPMEKRAPWWKVQLPKRRARVRKAAARPEPATPAAPAPKPAPQPPAFDPFRQAKDRARRRVP